MLKNAYCKCLYGSTLSSPDLVDLWITALTLWVLYMRLQIQGVRKESLSSEREIISLRRWQLSNQPSPQASCCGWWLPSTLTEQQTILPQGKFIPGCMKCTDILHEVLSKPYSLHTLTLDYRLEMLLPAKISWLCLYSGPLLKGI